MKKILLIVVLVLGIFVVVSWIQRARVVSVILSHKIHSELTMKKIDFAKGDVKMEQFALKNPFGYKSSYAMTSDRIEILFPKEEGFFPGSNIDKLKIEKGVVHVDCESFLCHQNNWTKIMGRAKSNGKPRSNSVKIASVVLDNFTVNIHGLGLKKGDTVIHYDHLELSNISSEEGFPTQLLIQEIFKSAGVDQYLKEGIQKTTEKFLKKFF